MYPKKAPEELKAEEPVEVPELVGAKSAPPAVQDIVTPPEQSPKIPTPVKAASVFEAKPAPSQNPAPPRIETRPPVEDIPEDFFPPGIDTPLGGLGLEETKFSISFSDSPLKAEDMDNDANIIDAMIRILSEGNISEKVDAIVKINDILSQDLNEPQMVEL